MIEMVVGGVIKSITDFGGSVISILTKNKFLATLFLILVLYFAGNIVSGIVVGNDYSCRGGDIGGNGTQLVDEGLYQRCFTTFTRGWIYKSIVNTTDCVEWVQDHDNDTEWNATCNEIVKLTRSVADIKQIVLGTDYDVNAGFFQGVGNLLNRIVKIMKSPFESIKTFITYVTQPNMCDELYTCLSVDSDAVAELGLFPDCSFERGMDAEDDYPTYDQYQNATTIFYPDGVQVAGMFFIDCVGTGTGFATTDYEPKLTFFGLNIFDWKLWIFIVILLAVFAGYQKYGSMLKR